LYLAQRYVEGGAETRAALFAAQSASGNAEGDLHFPAASTSAGRILGELNVYRDDARKEVREMLDLLLRIGSKPIIDFAVRTLNAHLHNSASFQDSKRDCTDTIITPQEPEKYTSSALFSGRKPRNRQIFQQSRR
jgi:hypothetical protein